MILLKKENVITVDCDDTIVMHVDPQDFYPEDLVKVPDPLHKDKTISLLPNHPMIRLLMEEAHRGACVVVWSRGGHEWATNVVVALKLQKYVTMIMSKPLAYFDDKPVSEWLQYRVYIKPTEIYKNRG